MSKEKRMTAALNNDQVLSLHHHYVSSNGGGGGGGGRGNQQQQQTGSRSTNLHAAAEENNLELVEYLLSSGGASDVNVQDKQGWTPVHCAAHNIGSHNRVSMEIFALFLGLPEVDVQIRTYTNNSLLHMLTGAPRFEDPALKGTFFAFIDLLLNKGASVNELNKQGETPLHMACYRGDVDLVKRLLQAHANPNCVNIKEESCLHYAVRARSIPVITALLEAGANVCNKCCDGTALDIAKMEKFEEGIKILEKASK
eukprot:TRINITY_DN4849_c0_g1_i1.p1 TRINITY_DN4849_c0_g1~~TRINITY_DN4849_c0_g1_i1.p1  ORF type:complete len:273 (+),score=83.72 TRINITY_DN4849_c0_g1_i1:56-820(+)